MRVALITVACLLASCAHPAAQRRPFRDVRCLALRGCSPAASIPRCDANSATAAGGDLVTLRGRLGTTAVICTEALCPGRCCNECRGALSIYDGRRHVELVGADWTAVGDDSALCYRRGARDQEVIVRGTLRSARGGVDQLVVAEACTP